jgi:hypothetical protein
MNTTIVIDKLILNLYYPLYEDLPRFLLQANNSISTSELTPIRDYAEAFIISYRGQEIGFLNSGFHLNSIMSQIVISNRLFYENQNLLKSFLVALKLIDIDIEVSCMEVAVDSDSDIHAKRYNRLKKSSKLKLAKNHISQTIKRDYINNLYIPNAPMTIYTKLNAKSKRANLRFENKTLEILLKSNKHYITDYHKKNGLDINKDIYRFELVIPNAESLNLSINPFYISNEDASKSITSYRRSVLVKALDDIELRDKGGLVFDSNALKTRMTLDEYTSLRNVKTRYDIDITRLFDEDYLAVIFSTFGGSIIKNLKAILKNNMYTKEMLKTKKINMETKEKRQTKLVINHKIGMAEHLSKERNISFDEALRWVTEFILGVEKYDIDVTDLSKYLEAK